MRYWVTVRQTVDPASFLSFPGWEADPSISRPVLPGRPDQLSRPAAGFLALLEDGRARRNRHVVAVDMLDQAASAGRQVEDHLWGMQVQPVEVDDVHIRLQARLQPATVAEAEEFCRLARHLLNHILERQARPARAVTHPVGQ